MKSIIIIALTFALFIPITSFAATEHVVYILPGTAQPGCEKTDECFSPSDVYVEVGDHVRFENKDSAMHAIRPGTPQSGMGDWSLPGPYTEKGYFPFFDMVHPWMVGAVIVGIDEPPEQEDPIKKVEEKQEEVFEEQQLSRIEHLEKRNNELTEIITERDDQIRDLQFTIKKLENKINNLNALVMEQVKIIYDWVLGK